MNFSHKSVLLSECIEALNIRENMTYVDCTTGGAGHSLEIVKRLGKGGRLICLDRDRDALKAARARLSDYLDRVTFVHTNFSEIASVLRELSLDRVGGVLMDLGCSSYQFDTPERGFSYMHDAPLDMRMDRDDDPASGSGPLTAYRVVNEYSFEQLRRVIDTYGEEKFASKIASAIVRERQKRPLTTTAELSALISSVIPKKSRIEGPHPAKRTFQAIRIEVNGELDAIAPAIRDSVSALAPGGRIAIISFHSLEDRIVKTTYNDLTSPCTCPRDFPVCVCGREPQIRVIGKKPILPGKSELEENPRSRSAKLRIAEKII
ncbi:MAG: 16S rRNA (cytosine(1402)-N(4))-methyltransferase RsmH [Clostridia bacterium]|nr:16S rRNA (cytosine(1402)-N(4))-methyltransferase RsmH [Clostridia bacterium]